MSDNIPSGYKRTEVGVIPEDWEIVTLTEYLVRSPEYGINAAAVSYSANLPAYIRITDISEDGRFTPDPITSVDHPNSADYFLEPDDLVFARTGASVGKAYLYSPEDGPLVFAGFLIRVRVNISKLIPQYLAQWVKTTTYWNWVNVMSMRSGQPGINGQEYASMPFPLPPTLTEQHAIADALSEVDAEIAALDAAIAKKRDLKQGAMQRLLTGEERLPGFSGAWEVKRLGEILKYEQPNNYLVQSTDYDDQGIPVLTAGKTFILGYTNEDFGIYETLPVIVFDDFTTASRYVDFRFKVKSSAIKLLTLQEDTSILWFISGIMQLIQHPIGEHKRYYISEFQDIEITVPNYTEQHAIATVLSDMDAEITALEAEREKTVALKGGMMQNLLTGKVRLI